MKKKSLILVLLVFLMCLTGCGKKEKYTEITYKEFKQKIENKETFPLFVGSSDCFHCDNYKVTLNKFISKYKVDVYYIDVANMEKDEMNEFLTVVNFKSTPTTVFITDGIEKTTYNRIVGELPYSKVVSKFKKAGYIKEK